MERLSARELVQLHTNINADFVVLTTLQENSVDSGLVWEKMNEIDVSIQCLLYQINEYWGGDPTAVTANLEKYRPGSQTFDRSFINAYTFFRAFNL